MISDNRSAESASGDVIAAGTVDQSARIDQGDQWQHEQRDADRRRDVQHSAGHPRPPAGQLGHRLRPVAGQPAGGGAKP